MPAAQRSATLARHADCLWRKTGLSVALVPWHGHVAVCALISAFPGQGHGSRAVGALCRWADCAGVTLELTPCGSYGSDVDRLAGWFARYGWAANFEVPREGLPKQSMIRYPIAGRGHRRCLHS